MKVILSMALFGLIFYGTAFCQEGSRTPSESPSISMNLDASQDDIKPQEREADVVYVPTPQEVVDLMLNLAKVSKNDVVYDLGSGDGRIPITAAKKYGVKATGIEIRPELVKEARENAEKEGVADKAQFMQQDLFKTDFSEATVVTLYLLPSLNVKLRPKLLQELKPGSRIVSHAFDMGEWKPDQVEELNGKRVYLWTVPKKVPKNLL
ncbi:MAG: SAM-dependent methyltransferase [Oligoflexus sp.]